MRRRVPSFNQPTEDEIRNYLAATGAIQFTNGNTHAGNLLPTISRGDSTVADVRVAERSTELDQRAIEGVQDTNLEPVKPHQDMEWTEQGRQDETMNEPITDRPVSDPELPATNEPEQEANRAAVESSSSESEKEDDPERLNNLFDSFPNWSFLLSFLMTHGGPKLSREQYNAVRDLVSSIIVEIETETGLDFSKYLLPHWKKVRNLVKKTLKPSFALKKTRYIIHEDGSWVRMNERNAKSVTRKT